jgi:hypothetical protein
LNGDGIVSCPDLAVIAEAYGSHTGASDFNAWSDLNNDGVINLLDFDIVSKKVPASCPNQNLVRNVTFESTLDDIQAAVDAELITNRGVANALAEQFKEAKFATSGRHESDDVREILIAFVHLVNAQTGKHILGIAAPVLRQDGTALLSQFPRTKN